MIILQSIYWILLIAVMLLLLINGIKMAKSDKEFRRYMKKQEAILNKQARDMFLRDMRDLLKEIKIESEVK